MKQPATGPTEQLRNLPSDTPRPFTLAQYRKYLMPTLIIAVCCLILTSFHASGLPRWQEWGWTPAERNLFVLVGAPLAGVVFVLVLQPLIAAYRQGRGRE